MVKEKLNVDSRRFSYTSEALLSRINSCPIKDCLSIYDFKIILTQVKECLDVELEKTGARKTLKSPNEVIRHNPFKKAARKKMSNLVSRFGLSEYSFINYGETIEIWGMDSFNLVLKIYFVDWKFRLILTLRIADLQYKIINGKEETEINDSVIELTEVEDILQYVNIEKNDNPQLTFGNNKYTNAFSLWSIVELAIINNKPKDTPDIFDYVDNIIRSYETIYDNKILKKLRDNILHKLALLNFDITLIHASFNSFMKLPDRNFRLRKKQ